MTAPMRLRLDQATRTAVSERYEHARTNCQMVLLADEGRHAIEVAWLVRRGPDQVRSVLHRFQAEGLAGLAPRKHLGRAQVVTTYSFYPTAVLGRHSFVRLSRRSKLRLPAVGSGYPLHLYLLE